MNRIIKFRAWDKDRREMFEVSSLSFWTNEEAGNDTAEDTKYQDYTGNYHNNCELMQFTGLKDKNGKEIYEGDIVTRIQTVYPYDDTRVVEWKNYHSQNGWNVANGSMWKVIGNVHMNPDLLTDKIEEK